MTTDMDDCKSAPTMMRLPALPALRAWSTFAVIRVLRRVGSCVLGGAARLIELEYTHAMPPQAS